jgi:1,4-dihydroxy-2-naphthoate octaprenyltransferase
MKAYEFPLKVTSDGTIQLPETFLASLPSGQCARVIVLVNEAEDVEEDAGWSRLTAQQFSAGYGETDAIYDRI